MFCGSFFAYFTRAVLLYCLFGDRLNATGWIALYLELNETSSSFGHISMLCSFAAAFTVFGMSE